VTLVMGMDQHRAQISAEWIDTITGEISRARVAPADRAGVRKFLARFEGEDLEVALEATTGWRFVVEELQRVGADVHLAEPAETSALKGKKKRREDRLGRCPASARAVVDRPAGGVVDPARASARSPRPGPLPAHAVAAADGMAAADAGGALTGVLDKHAPTHRALAGGDTALKQLARLLKARRCLREQHVAVRAVRPQRERLAREHSASRPGGLPRLVDQILGAVPRHGSVSLGANRDRGEVLLHPNTNTGPAGRRRST
jgi:hypothetical protein